MRLEQDQASTPRRTAVRVRPLTINSVIEIGLFDQAINILAVVVVAAIMGDACMITS